MAMFLHLHVLSPRTFLFTDDPKPVHEFVLGGGVPKMTGSVKKSQWVIPPITDRNRDESDPIQKHMTGLGTCIPVYSLQHDLALAYKLPVGSTVD